MAIAFARVSVHSRSHGLSAVAGAAYRAAEKLVDKRTGETHNFEKRNDVCYSEILLPENADEAFLDREFLWNAVELAEKRKDAQVAKDIILALPCEMDLTSQIELAKDFANYHFVSKGLVADMAIHDHADKGRENETNSKPQQEKKRNPHAHIYITTRRLLGKHFDRYKARDLNPVFANGKGGKGFIQEHDYWGEQWREFQTDYFKQQGLDIIVDENQLLPQRHQGRIRDNDSHYLKQENVLLKSVCVEIALSDPLSIINHLSLRYAVFSERQLANLIFKSTQTSEQFQQVLIQVKAHKDIICLGLGEDGKPRYTTRVNYLKEAQLAEQADDLVKLAKEPVKTSAMSKTILTFQLSSEQQRALYHVMDTPSITAIVGHAGTGKSYLLKAANALWQQAGLNVKGISVSGIAAKGLEENSQISSRTIASFKQRVLNATEQLSENDVIIMDEAGMTDLGDMAFIVNVVKQAKAKLVLVGDPNQLQPIGPGAPFRALVEHIGVVEMADIRRQVYEGDKLASQWLALGNTDDAIKYYQDKGVVHWYPQPIDAMQQLVLNWASALKAHDNTLPMRVADIFNQQPHPLAEQLILAHRNKDVDELNRLAREQLITQGWVSSISTTVEITQRLPSANGWDVRYEKVSREFAIGDRILFRQNDKTLGVYNGEFATIQAIESTNQGHQLTVTRDRQQDSQKTITFSTKEYNTFDYGYAATVHKAQGVTVDNVFVYAGGKGWNRHLAYVALTRHRKNMELHVDKQTFAKPQDFHEQLKRQEVKDSVLDWPVSYAIRRGFEPESLIGRLLEKVHGIKSSLTDVWLGLRDYAALRSVKQEQDVKMNNHSSTELTTIHSKSARANTDVTIATTPFNSHDKNSQKTLTPNASSIKEKQLTTIAKNHPVDIDWLSPKYQKEWKQLRTVDEKPVQWMVKFYDLAQQKLQDKKSLTSINQSITNRLDKVISNKRIFDAVKQVAPKLACRIQEYAKSRVRDKGIDIDF